MYRLTRTIVAILLLLGLFSSPFLAAPETADARGLFRARSAALQQSPLITETTGYRLSYSEDGSLPPVRIVETRRFRLIYPRPFEKEFSLEQLLEVVNSGFDRIERRIRGRFSGRIDVMIPLKIESKDEDQHEHLRTLGLQFTHNGRVRIAVALPYAKSDHIFAHEALHARLRQLGIRPIWWLEEGIAEFVEHEDGFSEEHFKRLEENGPLTVAELNELPSGSEKEMQARATAWAIVYTMVKTMDKSLEDVAQARTVPSSEKAFETVKEHHSQSRKKKAA